MSAIFKHRLHVNIGGRGTRPIVAMWCSDCLSAVGDFEQTNRWDELQEAAVAHCATPSLREQSRGPAEPTNPVPQPTTEDA